MGEYVRETDQSVKASYPKLNKSVMLCDLMITFFDSYSPSVIEIWDKMHSVLIYIYMLVSLSLKPSSAIAGAKEAIISMENQYSRPNISQ